MFPASFGYFAARSLEEALALLTQHGEDAKLLAGGHSLIPAMKLRLVSPRYLIDLGQVPTLHGMRLDGQTLVIGALTVHADVAAAELVHQRLPGLAEAASLIGDMQVRNRGTIGGSVAHADPAADFPVILTALNASFVLASPAGRRTVSADDFFIIRSREAGQEPVSWYSTGRKTMPIEQLPTTVHRVPDMQPLLTEVSGDTNADLLTAFVGTVLRARDLDRGDLKLMHRTVRELRYALSVFARYRDTRKVTVFGSARALPSAPTYGLARAFAQRMAEAGFMVITGAGAGIMHAAQEGAGRENSFGLNILLPFEQGANEVILNDPKLIYFKYFFVRKLIFVKETDAFALFPGGFGTHDEACEALTLLQTGKSTPVPIVFVDAPGSTYWQDWYAFVQRHMLQSGLISASDMHLFKVTSDLDEAVSEITAFYRNYHSLRYVNGQLLIRLQRLPATDVLARLNVDFRDILKQGDIVAVEPPGDGLDEAPHLPRLMLWFSRIRFGRLRQLIDVLNQC